MSERIHRAPWCKTLVVTSVLATALCAGVGIALPVFVSWPGVGWTTFLMLALPPICALFVVRGYRITPDSILVLRPGWVTRLPRAGLESVGVEPGAMRSCIRLCGNGGFFSFTGSYWSKPLGRFRAFVTELQLTVVLRYGGRTVILSPEEPAEFVRELQGTR